MLELRPRSQGGHSRTRRWEGSRGLDTRWGQRICDDLRLSSLPRWGADSLSLQGKMTCQLEASGRPRGSWEFHFDGHKLLVFDSEQRSWTAWGPLGGLLNNTLHSDKALINSLVRSLTTDCERWYKNIWKSPDNVLTTTGN